MSSGDSVSPRHAELMLQAFKRMKAEFRTSTSVSTFWDLERKTKERECLQSLDRTEVEQAFHDLTLRGLAKQLSDDYYELIDPKITPDVVMRGLLKSSHDETWKHLNRFLLLRRIERLMFWCAVALMPVTLAAIFLGTLVPTTYSQIAMAGFLILFFGAGGIQALGSRFWKKHELSFEKVLGVRLIDAYDRFMSQDSAAGDAVRRVSQSLQGADEPTKWSTLDRERESLTKIGRDIDVRLIPAMTDKNRVKADIGEVLVRLACLFFEGSSESMSRVPEVYKNLPVREPNTPISKPTPTSGPVPTSKAPGVLVMLVRSTVRDFVMPAAVMVVVSVLVFYVIASLAGKPLSDFFGWIGSAFTVSFLALVGRRLERH